MLNSFPSLALTPAFTSRPDVETLVIPERNSTADALLPDNPAEMQRPALGEELLSSHCSVCTYQHDDMKHYFFNQHFCVFFWSYSDLFCLKGDAPPPLQHSVKCHPDVSSSVVSWRCILNYCWFCDCSIKHQQHLLSRWQNEHWISSLHKLSPVITM